MSSISEQPAGSRILCEGIGKHLSLRVPAPGFGSRTYGIVPILLILTTGVAFSLWAFIQNPRFAQAKGLDYWYPFGLLVFFLAACVVGLIISCHFATRSVRVEIDGRTLVVRFQGVLWESVRRLNADEIQSIKVNYNTMIRPKYQAPPLELEILGHHRFISFGTGLPRKELEWVAAVVNQSLNRNQ